MRRHTRACYVISLNSDAEVERSNLVSKVATEPELWIVVLATLASASAWPEQFSFAIGPCSEGPKGSRLVAAIAHVQLGRALCTNTRASFAIIHRMASRPKALSALFRLFRRTTEAPLPTALRNNNVWPTQSSLACSGSIRLNKKPQTKTMNHHRY